MILAEKIVNLRKQAGWSQEELAEKLGVSRQAVSKWESAQSIPDLNKVLLLSEVFSVSTDYLLKDDSDVPGEVLTETKTVMDDDGDRLLPVSLEEANAFLELEQALVPRTAAGVFLCIISSVPLILLSGAAEAGKLPITEKVLSARSRKLSEKSGHGAFPQVCCFASSAVFRSCSLLSSPERKKTTL